MQKLDLSIHEHHFTGLSQKPNPSIMHSVELQVDPFRLNLHEKWLNRELRVYVTLWKCEIADWRSENQLGMS